MSDTPDQSAIGVVPAARRAAAIWLGGTMVFVALAMAWLVLRHPLGLPRNGFFRWVPLILIILPFAVGMPFWHWRVRRLRRALFAARFRLCTHCTYDLSTLAPTGTCPECGHEYDAARDVERWAQTGAPYAEPRPEGFSPWSASDAPDPPTS